MRGRLGEKWWVSYYVAWRSGTFAQVPCGTELSPHTHQVPTSIVPLIGGKDGWMGFYFSISTLGTYYIYSTSIIPGSSRDNLNKDPPRLPQNRCRKFALRSSQSQESRDHRH